MTAGNDGVELFVPDLGETDQIEFVSWLVQPGDSVSEGQELAELVTDKAAFTLEAPAGGRLLEVFAQPGEIVSQGQRVGRIGSLN